MKKHILYLLLLSLILPLSAEQFTLTESFGGNSDKLAGNDFFLLNQAINSKDKIYYKNLTPMSLSNRLQLDIDNDIIEGRIRMDTFPTLEQLSEEDIAYSNTIKGYGKINLSKNISLVAGNSYFSKFDIKAAELFSLDTTPNYGKIIKSGLGFYSEFPFNEKSSTVLKLGTCLENDTYTATTKDLKLSLGGDYIFKNKMYAGFSARNVTATPFGKYSILLGGKFKDFKVNAGFIYNNTDDDILPYEAKYSASLSTKYKNDDLKYTLSADIVTGLTSEYLSTDKGKTKNYDNNAVPFMAALNFDYDLSKKATLAFNAKLTDMINASNNLCITLYPNYSYKFDKKSQEISAGARFEFNEKTGRGLTKISIPVCYKVKFSKE